jgi:DNA-binding NtrC family response regulator
MNRLDEQPEQEASGQTMRRRDRRQGLTELLAALTRHLDRKQDVVLMRGAFEQSLKRIVPFGTVHLREPGGRWGAGADDARHLESIAVDVPGADGGVAAVLEARFEPGCLLGDWELQSLGLAAHVGALVLEIERTRTELGRLAAPMPRLKRDGAAPLIGSTPAIQALRSNIERIANTDFTVLLEGESGVGKELVAQQIHDLSRRRHGPFVAINCAALVETLLEAELFGIEDRTATGVRGRRGKFEHADGGTLFLDEVSDLAVSAQAKLLRVIQELAVERVGGQGAHRVDIRIIAATNRGLAHLVERGTFRADLFYRLSGVDIRVPPLRERREDVMELAQYFLARHRSVRPLRLSPSAADALIMYQWPGNVRELQRMMERAIALAESNCIELNDLPLPVRGDYGAAVAPALARNDSLRAWASRYARLVLDRCGGNKREACRRLRISYHTLQAYLRFPVHDPVAPDGDPDGSDDNGHGTVSSSRQSAEGIQE